MVEVVETPGGWFVFEAVADGHRMSGWPRGAYREAEEDGHRFLVEARDAEVVDSGD